MWLLLGALSAGMAAGIVTGLLPGLHPNTVLFLLLPAALEQDGVLFVAFITGTAVVHTFVSFVPAIFLAAPEGDTALAALPGRKAVADGRGVEAVKRTVYGGVVAGGLAVLLLPVFWLAVPPLYAGLVPVMHLVLAAVVLLMVAREENPRAALRVVGLAGLLGRLALEAPPANVQYILLPVFGGLFGVSTALLALRVREPVPEQDRERPVPVPVVARGGVLALGAALLAGFLPGLGTAQSAVLVDRGLDVRRWERLVVLGGITTADLFLSIAALKLIGNPRSGAAVAVAQVLGTFPFHRFLLVVGMTLVAVGIGALATPFIARRVAGILPRFARPLLCLVILLLAGATLVLTGWFGMLVLLTATALGLHTAASGVRRSCCMAVLLVPTILFYAAR